MDFEEWYMDEDYRQWAVVLVHVDGMAVAESPDGKLLWDEIPLEYAEPGMGVEWRYMHELTELPPDKQQLVLDALDDMPEGLYEVLMGIPSEEELETLFSEEDVDSHPVP